MKRYILTALAALFLGFSAMAVPAKPGAFTYRQPDGSVIRLELHGDEFFSWTTLAGTSQVVAKAADGFYQPATLDQEIRRQAYERRREVNRQRRSSIGLRTHTDNLMTHGERRIPVIMVEFKDVKFTLTEVQGKFDNFLNQQGYSYDGATGSVRDFYVDNSDGQFLPIFDVYGPVTLDNDLSYYGEEVRDAKGKVIANDKQPELALYDACVKLDDQVDFSVYDYDGDGLVDMTLFYYAGYSQAEGGSSDSIWPHQYSLQYNSQARNKTFDGLKLGSYFCTAELRGSSGSKMCGIGVTAHEFGHSLGLPDFYDTDYEENGSAGGLYDFSIMDGGSYLNDSRTPPYYNAEERIFLGWMVPEDIQELPEGSLSFGSVKDGIAYKSYTETEGEYFIYECRDGSGWDTYLPQGLLVYHVDKSTVREVGGLTPYQQWDEWGYHNSINAYGDHPCFYIVPAANQNSLNYKGSLSEIVFPGTKRVKTYSPVDWDGNETGLSLSDIAYANGQVSLKAVYTLTRALKGTVVNPAGSGVEGVYVVLQTAQQGQAPRLAPRIIDRRADNGQSYEAVTDEYGRFVIELDGYEGSTAHISLAKEGFLQAGYDIQLRNGITSVKFTLYPDYYESQITFQNYDDFAKAYLYGDGQTNSMMAAFRIPAGQLPEKGGVVNSVSFFPSFPAQYYIIIDSGTERLLTYPLPEISNYHDLITIDLIDLQVSFPPDRDLYIGYGLEDASCPDGYDGYLFYTAEGNGNTYLSSLNLESSSWSGPDTQYSLDLKASATIIPDTGSGGTEIDSFGQMGINAITDPEKGAYQAGYAFPLTLDLAEGVNPSSVVWTHNGRDVSGAKSVTLTSGKNTLTAVLKLADGSVETLELVLNVQ